MLSIQTCPRSMCSTWDIQCIPWSISCIFSLLIFEKAQQLNCVQRKWSLGILIGNNNSKFVKCYLWIIFYNFLKCKEVQRYLQFHVIRVHFDPCNYKFQFNSIKKLLSTYKYENSCQFCFSWQEGLCIRLNWEKFPDD